MGSRARLEAQLRGTELFASTAINQVADSCERLQNAGDAFSDILYYLGDTSHLGLNQEQCVDALRKELLKLSIAVDKIAIAKPASEG